MASLPTPEEIARRILGLFRHERIRPGEDLLLRKFFDAAAQNAWPTSRVTAGVEFGLAQGWFYAGPSNALRLTTAGFAEMRR